MLLNKPGWDKANKAAGILTRVYNDRVVARYISAGRKRGWILYFASRITHNFDMTKPQFGDIVGPDTAASVLAFAEAEARLRSNQHRITTNNTALAAMSKELTALGVKHHLVIAAFETLQPDTVLTLYHGTDEVEAAKLLKYGLDGTKVVQRTHNQGNERGLYVTPDQKTARDFGNIVFEFKAPAKLLFPTARWGIGSAGRKTDYARKTANERYPKSFRPIVSIQMNDTVEPQAMLIGYVPVRNIAAVWFSKPEDPKAVRHSVEEAAKLLSLYKVSNYSGDETAEDVLQSMLTGRSLSYAELLDILTDEHRHGTLSMLLNDMGVPRKLNLRVQAFIKAQLK
jgi:hypothetical protein